MSIFLLLISGLLALAIGGELLVRGSVSAAKSLNISPMIIGITLVGFGTSTPELVTSLQAAFLGSSGIAVGNVIGSNIANILLILGLAALIAPIAVNVSAFRRDGTVLALASWMCLAMVLYGEMTRLIGVVFFCSLIAYLIFAILSERRGTQPAASEMYKAEAEIRTTPKASIMGAILLTLAGLVVTILGARFFVSGAVDLAKIAGLSETVIGLTIVAVGTSLPEFVTSIIAVRKGQGDVAFGNIIGSNIFNILCILGVTAIVQPIVVPPQIARLDIWIMLGAVVLMAVFARTGWRVGRREGATMLALYIAYLIFLLA